MTPRFTPFGDLAPYDEAIRRVLATVTPVRGVERVALAEAAGRVLAEPAVAPFDVPGFDRSAMDGYAVRAADIADAEVTLPVAGVVHAGDATTTLTPGTAVQIATGGEVPRGADMVVRFEDTTRDGDKVTIATTDVEPGRHVSIRGGDLAAGGTVIPAGARITPARIGVLASLGLAAVDVLARPRVGVLVTGNEVKAAGTPLGPGEVYDSAGPTVAAFAAQGGAAVTTLPRAPDRAEALADAIRAAVDASDLVVTTGGSSVGERDLLRGVIEDALGGEVLVHGVAQRPGKPILAAIIGGKLLLGLPGYPASTLVCAHLFLGPVLDVMGGATPSAAATVSARLSHDIPKKKGLLLYVPVRVADGMASSTFKESGAMSGLANADGYVTFPADLDGPIAAGTAVDVVPY